MAGYGFVDFWKWGKFGNCQASEMVFSRKTEVEAWQFGVGGMLFAKPKSAFLVFAPSKSASSCSNLMPLPLTGEALPCTCCIFDPPCWGTHISFACCHYALRCISRLDGA